MDFKSTTISYIKLIHFLTELEQLQASHSQSWHTLQLKENNSFFFSQYNFHTSFRGIWWLLWSSRSSLWRQAKAKGVQTRFCPSHRSLWSCRQHVGLRCTTKIPPTSPLPPTCGGVQHMEGKEQSQGNRGGFDPGCNSSKMPSPLCCPRFPPEKETFWRRNSSLLVLLFEQRSSLLVLGRKRKLSLSLCSLSEWKINN